MFYNNLKEFVKDEKCFTNQCHAPSMYHSYFQSHQQYNHRCSHFQWPRISIFWIVIYIYLKRTLLRISYQTKYIREQQISANTWYSMLISQFLSRLGKSCLHASCITNTKWNWLIDFTIFINNAPRPNMQLVHPHFDVWCVPIYNWRT